MTSHENRPNPDALLQQIMSEDAEKAQGKLKIFFGYAAGVGKTFAMLEAAHAAVEAGIEVVAGYIEPHTRPQTRALLEGLEILPTMACQYKELTLQEFDLDGALLRQPQLILVDELAHSNALGCRNRKRYQDIEELLKLGIDVYTTVNVQHIESLNDIVASITGVVVRERIPDSVFDNADQVELVDIEPDDLIKRLNQGRIYQAGQAERALDNFFTRDNLIALREIALRRTADRVNKLAGKSKQITQKHSYYTGEHILICLSSSPSNAKVIRTAARLADAFHGFFTALYVETPAAAQMSAEDSARLRSNLKLAEQLGARIATVYGEDLPYQIAEYSKISGISKIVIGRTNNKQPLIFKKQAFIDRLTALAPNLDIYVIPDNFNSSAAKHKPQKVVTPRFSLTDTLKTIAILATSTLIGFWFFKLGFSEANIITIYILGVLFVAFVTEGKVYSLISSLVSVLVFNFLFTYPYFSLEAFDSGYPITFLIMFLAAFLTGTLTKRVKEQARVASIKAYRTEVLLDTSQKLQRSQNSAEILSAAAEQMIKLLERDIIFYTAGDNHLNAPQLFAENPAAPPQTDYLSADEQAVAHWVYKNNKHAGATTNTLPGVKCLYMAVRSKKTVFAVVGIAMNEGEDLEAFEKNILLAMLSECALALEKESITQTKNKITQEAKQEQLRANLLRAISHDLRTPLTAISGNASVLMGNAEGLTEAQKQELYTDIYDDSVWLINLVENLLAVTRIENGAMSLKLEPQLMQEVIDEALCHIDRKSREHQIQTVLDDDLLMAQMDTRLIVQVLINMVDNAIKYTQAGSQIIIAARRLGERVEVSVTDNGRGIAEQDKQKIFEMFYTADNFRGDGRRGLGLGLALCKAIITAHGGIIQVEDNLPHGTRFTFTLAAQEVKIYE